MTTTQEKQEKIALEMAASASKGALVEKIVFAGVPILFSCVVYLMNALGQRPFAEVNEIISAIKVQGEQIVAEAKDAIDGTEPEETVQ